jgi:hypothetical protein
MKFISSLISRKLAVTVAAGALIQSLPMTADWKGICTAAVAFAYVLAQAYVDAQEAEPVPALVPATPVVAVTLEGDPDK